MPKIFISYRRADSQYAADPIYAYFRNEFGAENVFLDVGSIPFGVDFRDYLRDQIAQHDVVLVIIGPQWESIMHERAEEDNDFVRVEIENALQQNKLLIPVLVMEAQPPDFSELPESIQELQWRNAARVRREPDFSNDCARIVDNIRQYRPITPTEDPIAQDLKGTSHKRRVSWQTVLVSSIIVAILAIVVLASIRPPQPPNFNATQPTTISSNPSESPITTPSTTVTVTHIPTPTDAPGPTPVPTVSANNQWTPVIQEFDGVEMVLIPPGCFMMGSTDGSANELPVHEICFDTPFWIDRYEVTNGQYGSVGRWAGENRPRENLNWMDALAHCRSRSARLPTEAEWEYAARGPDNLAYPWDNEFEGGNVVYVENSNNETSPVGSRPGGRSWVSAHDMSGNVWEWVSTIYDPEAFPYPYDPDDGREDLEATDVRRVLRGGSLENVPLYVRTTDRFWGKADEKRINWGFRCAREYTIDVAPTPVPIVTANKQWTPIIQEFDGVEMVLVPPGCFMMGSTDEQIQQVVEELDAQQEWMDDEQPAHEVCFYEPFWIDRYEVTNRQYGSSGNWSGDNRPREEVDWFDSLEHCRSRDARLPTEAEREYAARGPNNLLYPWGNRFVGENVVYSDNSNEETATVGSRPGGVSWVGAFDLNGNVWEWVSTMADQDIFPYPYATDDGRNDLERAYVLRVVRGGSWQNPRFGMRAADRGWYEPHVISSIFGLRCARDYTPVIEPTPVVKITGNDQWNPVVQEFDGVEMVLVPPGCFMMGSEEGADDQRPIHEICFDKPYWIDRYEVSNFQFAQFDGQAANTSQWTAPNLPREMISWFEAKNFCETRDAHLPTEPQWEYAARGPNGLRYPWGDTFDNLFLHDLDENDEFPTGSTMPVDSLVAGQSWVGANNLVGNVSEWISTIYNQASYPYPYSAEDGREALEQTDLSRGVRGIFYNEKQRTIGSANRLGAKPDQFSYRRGFRCVRNW